MPISTLSVGAAVTPTIIETYISHYLNRQPLHQKPTAHISYHEGLQLVRQFLHYASFHTVEDIQGFTSQWVPVPRWVKQEVIEIPPAKLVKSAEYLEAQLGPEGIEQVGGKKWWQWRRDNGVLKAEWIEMRKDYNERKNGEAGEGQRIMLYVHGGAYYFGSVDEHRYQMQRHARKLKARVLAPRYRLAPQFPFPCGLYDCLAAYLYLLENHDPSTIILAGDSAGGGMVLSILVILRDQGVPLPAGAILISPWVDLTHSFPSLGGDGRFDYIPAHGFVHKPCMSWPPPSVDDMLELNKRTRNPDFKDKLAPHLPLLRPQSGREEKSVEKEAHKERVRGFSVRDAERVDVSTLKPLDETTDGEKSSGGSEKPAVSQHALLSIIIDGELIEIKDQIQLYAANHLINHPLVSPALQPSLGGFPPLLIQVGGGELLRDEQIYIAHKAASPLSYPPSPSIHQSAELIQSKVARYRPTNVQIQVWDDLCHVAPTLSFTRPAKFMYRSIAQFGAWALARAQKTSIDILDDDDVSVISASSSVSTDSNLSPEKIKLSMPHSAQNVGFDRINRDPTNSKDPEVGKAGDPLPSFEKHMIRQRVTRKGVILPLPPQSELEALQLDPSEIGVIKPGPVRKWMAAQSKWNEKFAKQKRAVQKKRIKHMDHGFEGFDGETPPPTALAGRRVKGMQKQKANKRSWGMSMWSVWGSKHDEMTIEREEKADAGTDQPSTPDTATAETSTAPDISKADPALSPPLGPRDRSASARGSFRLRLPTDLSRPRSRSRISTVTDRGQADATLEALAPSPGHAEAKWAAPEFLISAPETDGASPLTIVPESDTLSSRPTRNGVAYPFKLQVEGAGKGVNASTLTLNSVNEGVVEDEALEEKDKKDMEVERPDVERFVTTSEALNQPPK